MSFRDDLRNNKFAICTARTQNVQAHVHRALEFAYVLQGSMEHTIDGHMTILNEGDYFVVDHGSVHKYHSISSEKLAVMNFQFYPEFFEQFLAGTHSFSDVMNAYFLRFCHRTLHSSPTGITFHDKDNRIRTILEEINQENQQKQYGYLEYIRSRFAEILILSMRSIGPDSNPRGKSQCITQITEALNSNYPQKLHLADFAQAFNYSVPYLSKKFKLETGMCFMDYLHRVRIEHSCNYLQSTNMPIEEVASTVGYEDRKYFNKIFKEHLNVTPSEFRRKYS